MSVFFRLRPGFAVQQNFVMRQKRTLRSKRESVDHRARIDESCVSCLFHSPLAGTVNQMAAQHARACSALHCAAIGSRPFADRKGESLT
jgi:hypothetical protein